MARTVAVAMSGGVDSTTAALLLQEQGFTPVGLTMALFCGADVSADASAAARRLGIEHHLLDLSDVFRAKVMAPFVSSYERGETPNPCVECNRCLKFGALLDAAQALGCDRLATGHYVRADFDAPSGRWLLRKAVHPEKDQSYVLYTLTQQQLSRSLFPLGRLSKSDIRALAAARGLVPADKKESQDICFISDGDYPAFLRRFTGKSYPCGPFLDEDGQVLGQHGGIVNYTVGQRRGLGVSSNHGRLYVKQVRPTDNAIVLSENAALYAKALNADRLNLIACDALNGPVRLRAKVRYRMAEQPCTVEQTGENTVTVTFDAPQRAVTPGQAVVFYDGDVLVGGATIRGAF